MTSAWKRVCMGIGRAASRVPGHANNWGLSLVKRNGTSKGYPEGASEVGVKFAAWGVAEAERENEVLWRRVWSQVWTPVEKLGQMTNDKRPLGLAALRLSVTFTRVVSVEYRDWSLTGAARRVKESRGAEGTWRPSSIFVKMGGPEQTKLVLGLESVSVCWKTLHKFPWGWGGKWWGLFSSAGEYRAQAMLPQIRLSAPCFQNVNVTMWLPSLNSFMVFCYPQYEFPPLELTSSFLLPLSLHCRHTRQRPLLSASLLLPTFAKDVSSSLWLTPIHPSGLNFNTTSSGKFFWTLRLDYIIYILTTCLLSYFFH